MFKMTCFLLLILTVKANAQNVTLPFSFKTNERTENLPTYISPPQSNLYNANPNLKVGWGIDSPISHVIMDGEVWVIFNSGNQYGTQVKVARFKGTDFEHTVRQEDGIIEVGKGVSTHFCGGMWYDKSTRKLYAPIHCEYKNNISPPAGWSRKKTRLATSTNKGLTWRMEGDILTDCMPNDEDWLRFSGSYFEAGPGDFDFYVDSMGGYFYIFSCNAYAPKNGKMNNFLWFNEAARCKIQDKMEPGKWFKFCNGAWNEPGLGGKSSKLSIDNYGIYGRVIYSTFLKKYLRIGPSLGFADSRFTDTGFTDGSIYISVCDDLTKQEWSPKAKLIDKSDNKKLGITLTDGNSRNPFICDANLRIYNYWLYDIPSCAIDVTFAAGTTPIANVPGYGSYAYEPLLESGDPIVSRQTKIVGSSSPEISYYGSAWSAESYNKSYQRQIKKCNVPGSSLQFSWKGDAIYWRAIADCDGGKADVYIDDIFQETVDCYYEEPLPFQFAFIKSGLGHTRHSIRIVIKPDKNPLSSGTVIRHMAFEYTAESYKASAGFSSIMGKNYWYYRKRDGAGYSNLEFLYAIKIEETNQSGKEKFHYPNNWGNNETCIVGNNYQIPGNSDAVRTWLAPHVGRIRIEGTLEIEKDSSAVAMAIIIKNKKFAWQAQMVKFATPPVSHDFILKVKKGDAVNFVVKKIKWRDEEKVIWDPTITFID